MERETWEKKLNICAVIVEKEPLKVKDLEDRSPVNALVNQMVVHTVGEKIEYFK